MDFETIKTVPEKPIAIFDSRGIQRGMIREDEKGAIIISLNDHYGRIALDAVAEASDSFGIVLRDDHAVKRILAFIEKGRPTMIIHDPEGKPLFFIGSAEGQGCSEILSRNLFKS